ncbi:putative mucin-22-like [Sesbania bispinosa]|nr:putative mucin-22-like [Sesbania bispinosa]
MDNRIPRHVSRHCSKVPPPPTGPVESNAGQQRDAESQPKDSHNSQINVNTDLGEKSAAPAVHGDWLTVARPKRQQKSRSKSNQNSKDSGKGESLHDHNRFEAFKNDINSKLNDGEKLKEPGPTISKEGGQQKEDVAKANAGASSSVRTLPYGIKTRMNVEVVSPNCLRFIDEAKPPDLRGGNNDNTEIVPDSQPILIGIEEVDDVDTDREDQDMADESPQH